MPGESCVSLTDSMAAASDIPAEERATGGLTPLALKPQYVFCVCSDLDG